MRGVAEAGPYRARTRLSSRDPVAGAQAQEVDAARKRPAGPSNRMRSRRQPVLDDRLDLAAAHVEELDGDRHVGGEPEADHGRPDDRVGRDRSQLETTRRRLRQERRRSGPAGGKLVPRTRPTSTTSRRPRIASRRSPGATARTARAPRSSSDTGRCERRPGRTHAPR